MPGIRFYCLISYWAMAIPTVHRSMANINGKTTSFSAGHCESSFARLALSLPIFLTRAQPESRIAGQRVSLAVQYGCSLPAASSGDRKQSAFANIVVVV